MNNLAIYSNIIFGLLLLISYYYLGSNNSRIVEKLWGNIKGNKRKLVVLSMLVTGVLYLFTVYYIGFLTDHLDKDKINNIVLYQIILILASMLWMPLSINYLNKKELLTKIAVILILFIVAMCAMTILYKIFRLKDKGKYKNMALLGAGMLFFHTFFLDFLDWNYNFF